ncbi:hypothetical protein AAMO2058_000856200 [Amorphochlora amoebiformis]
MRSTSTLWILVGFPAFVAAGPALRDHQSHSCHGARGLRRVRAIERSTINLLKTLTRARYRVDVRGHAEKDELSLSAEDLETILGEDSANRLRGPVETEWEGNVDGLALQEADGLRGRHSFNPAYRQYIPPPQHFRIIHASVFLRHGDRTPISKTVGTALDASGDADFWASLLPDATKQDLWDELNPVIPKDIASRPYDYGKAPFGQLTRTGAMESERVGTEIRNRYVGSLLPEKVDLDSIKARTTNMRRTQQTMQNFLLGLYPADLRDPDNNEIPIKTQPMRQESLVPNSGHCPAYSYRSKIVAEEAKETPRVTKIDRQLMRGLGYPSGGIRWAQAREVLTCYLLQGRELPNNLTADDIDAIGEVNGFIWGAQFTDSTVARLSTGRLFAEVFSDFELAIDDPDDCNKMSLYSGHDSTLVPLLAALGVYEGQWPPYASYIVIELAESTKTGDHWVRVQYNNEELLMMDGFWNRYEDFSNYMGYYVLTDEEHKIECAAKDGSEDLEVHVSDLSDTLK